ncbi:hypothetical protein AGMMS49928_18090 [Spirochaetia bacterium]|nr:hypothetical protein AGMMS49928_18090 [Spirochaetia bacterium]
MNNQGDKAMGKRKNASPNEENKIILYQDDNGITNISVRFADEDLWLTQKQIAEVYDTTQPNISMHVDSILKDGELPEEATHKKFLLVQTEGKRQVQRSIDHYKKIAKGPHIVWGPFAVKKS